MTFFTTVGEPEMEKVLVFFSSFHWVSVPPATGKADSAFIQRVKLVLTPPGLCAYVPEDRQHRATTNRIG